MIMGIETSVQLLNRTLLGQSDAVAEYHGRCVEAV